MSKPFLYGHFNSASFCDVHRILYPIRFTGTDFPELDFTLSVTDPDQQFHYYVTHGCPPLNNIPHIGSWKRKGGKWILSLDDDFDSVPDWNPARLTDNQLNVYHAALDSADLVWSSTPQLTKAINKPHKTLTAPNLMDVGLYYTDTPARITPTEKLRVLWSGSKTHKRDLELLETALDYLIPKYSDKVEFLFVGAAPDRALKKYIHKGLYYDPGVSAGVYYEYINKINPHIVLAPLFDIPFNLCKSNIRILESWCLTAAVVASPIGEYNVIKAGVDGEFANTPQEWINTVEALINDQQYRERLAVNGRKRVCEEFDWNNSHCRKPWVELFTTMKSKLSL